MAKNRSKANKSSVKVNFKGVEARKVLIPDDEYLVEVKEVAKETSDKGNDNLVWQFVVQHEEDKFNGTVLYYNTSLLPQSLWNLRNLLETLGVDVPDGPLDIDLEEMVGLEMMAVVEAETFEGKKRSKIVDFYPVEGEGEEVEVDGEETGVEGMTEEDVMELDEEEIDEAIEKYNLEVNMKKAKTLKKKRLALVEAMEEAGFLIGEEEEEATDKLTVDEVSGMDDDELADVVKKYELDVDLKKLKTTRKKANAIIDALEEAGALAEEDD